MPTIVAKFGGTSLATPEHILRAARKVAHIHKSNDVVVVVSAMARTTDRLFSMSHEITSQPKARELDMLLTAGERVSVALLSMALGKLRLEAVSYTGSQVGIITDNRHTEARILEIKGDRIKKALAEDKIPVVCGFQGVSLQKEITTLGRGGSDTTAVALGATLKAERCIIYTDVDGVFTENPKTFSGVKKIGKLSYDEMLELSCRGAQVMHPRASSLASRFKIPVEIRSSFNSKKGTLITSVPGMEKPRPKAMTHCDDLYLITLVDVPKRSHYLSQIVTRLANEGINLKFFFHGISEAQRFNLSFITLLEEKERTRTLLEKISKRFRGSCIRDTTHICAVTVVGTGIGSENSILAGVFDALAKAHVHIEAVTTSELSINVFTKKKHLRKAVNVLLDRFRLKKKRRR
jgi:aspartate kinase